MSETSEESPAQRQARLRREKRNAKIQGEGADRLARISQMTGRSVPTQSSDPQAPRGDAAAWTAVAVADPDEVDISEHHWVPQSRPGRQQSDNDQAMSQFGPTPQSQGPPQEMQNDPMMQMMQQLMGQGANGGPQFDGNADMPPIFEAMQAMMGGTPPTGQSAQSPATTSSAYVWRIVHAVFAFGLAVYLAFSSTFDGSSAARLSPDPNGPRLFYMFGTLELILQTSRYMIEKGQLGGSGRMATILNLGIIPEPWANYLRLIARYSVIWQTIVADAMTVVFVLGTVAWWRSSPAVAV